MFSGIWRRDTAFSLLHELCLCSVLQQAKPPKQQGTGDAAEE